MCINRETLQDFDDFDADQRRYISYLESYPCLIKTTKFLLSEKGEKAILAIAHMCYGWMPKILTIHDGFENQKRAIFECKDVIDIEKAIEILSTFPDKPAINHSWVGLSKVLHFINPHVFPILDSHIASLYPDWKDNQTGYIAYIEFVHDNLDCDFIPLIQESVRDIFGYEITEVRALELVLFNMG